MEGVRRYLPVLAQLYHTHMKDRHRRNFFKMLYGLEGVEKYLEADENGNSSLSMQGLLELVLDNEQAQAWLLTIFKTAKKESELVEMLDGLQRRLFALALTIGDERSVSIQKVSNIEENQTKIGDTAAELDSLLGSQFIAGIGKVFGSMQQTVLSMQEALKSLKTTQEGLITLLRVFKA